MMTEDLHSHTESIENERSSSENVTIIAETFSDNGLASATMSSIKSQDSTEQLICKSPQHKSGSGRKIKSKSVDTREATLDRSYDNGNGKEICEKSIEMSAESSSSASSKSTPKYILLLGIGQLLVGIMMVVCGAMVIVHNSSLSRVGAGLWSGCIAIATGIVGVLAGINDCYGLSGGRNGRGSSPFLTAFLALSLASLAAGNMAAVLAGTGIYRDTHANEIPDELNQDFEDKKKARAPVLTNIGLLIISILHCVLALVCIYRTSKRVCSCFRPKEAFNHNQFDTSYKNNQSPYVIAISNERNQHMKNRKHQVEDNHLSPQEKHHRDMLCRNLESKLSSPHDQEMAVGNHPDSIRGQREKQKKKQPPVPANFGSANSKDKLVSSWLGRHHAVAQAKAMHAKQKQMKYGVRKMKGKQPQPVLLVPAPHPGSNTLGRPMAVRVVPAMGYGPAPLMQGPPPLYYPVGEMMRMRAGRRRSPTSPCRRPRSAGASGARRDSQLTRSLERIHRRARERDQPDAKRRGKRAGRADRDVTEQDVIRTYTGLDRTIAEQFIVACDETRNSIDKTDSSGFDTASSESHSHPF